MKDITALWSGRFSDATDKHAAQFSASIHYDKRLYRHDIEGSIAHAKMLHEVNLLSSDEYQQIVSGLHQIQKEIESGTFPFRIELEDIHMNIEARLTELIGAAGEKLHTARSRNDQVVNDVRMYLREETDIICDKITELQKALLEKADIYRDAIMPGFTHLQHAQPVVVAHHFLAYISMLDRDDQRFSDGLLRTNVLSLGACALGGTPLPIDRSITAKELDFPEISENSIDTVSDRDFIIEFLSCCAIVGVHISRLAEELVLWTSPEFNFASLPDTYCTGSSIMPQKKNPDMAELIRGKTGRLNGNLISLLTTMKGLPLSYNRDLQEDKEPLFDSIDTVKGMLSVCTGMITHLSLNKERMATCAESDFILATDVADYLVARKIPFRTAHEIVGKIVAYCINKKKTFVDLSLDEWQTFSSKFDSGISELLSPERSVARKQSLGSTSSKEVARQINNWKKQLGIK